MRHVPRTRSAAPSAADWRQASTSPRSTRREARRVQRRWTRRRWISGGVLVCLVLLAVACTHLAPPQAHPAAHPGGGQPTASAQASPTSVHQPSPTPATATAPTASELSGSSPTQVATRFLIGYFTWQPAESDASYVHRWQSVVEAEALALCIQNAPRLLLDEGADSAASGGTLQIPPGALQLAGQQGQLTVTWTVQVLPAGGELVEWQTRLIEATVALIQSADSLWHIGGVLWASDAKGGKR